MITWYHWWSNYVLVSKWCYKIFNKPYIYQCPQIYVFLLEIWRTNNYHQAIFSFAKLIKLQIKTYMNKYNRYNPLYITIDDAFRRFQANTETFPAVTAYFKVGHPACPYRWRVPSRNPSSIRGSPVL